MLYNIKQHNELLQAKRRYEAAGIRSVDGTLFDFQNNALIIHYTFQGFPLSATLSQSDLLTVLQFDPSIASYDAQTITDEDKKGYTWEAYFDSCPPRLILDFLLYSLVIEEQDKQLSQAA